MYRHRTQIGALPADPARQAPVRSPCARQWWRARPEGFLWWPAGRDVLGSCSRAGGHAASGGRFTCRCARGRCPRSIAPGRSRSAAHLPHELVPARQGPGGDHRAPVPGDENQYELRKRHAVFSRVRSRIRSWKQLCCPHAAPVQLSPRPAARHLPGFTRAFGCTRFVVNDALAFREAAHATGQPYPGRADLSARLTVIKATPGSGTARSRWTSGCGRAGRAGRCMTGT
jgi:hypothetical protein